MSLLNVDESIHEDLTQALLIDALEKERKEPQDVERILESIRGLEFFRNLFASQTNANEEAYLQVCASMKHEYHEMGNFVFKEGDPSNGKFYVILSGEVGVIIQTQFQTIFDKDKEKIEERRRTQVGVAVSVTNLDEEPPIQNSPPMIMRSNSQLGAPNNMLMRTNSLLATPNTMLMRSNSQLSAANSHLMAPNQNLMIPSHNLSAPSNNLLAVPTNGAERKRRNSKLAEPGSIILIPPPTIVTNTTATSNTTSNTPVNSNTNSWGGFVSAKRVSKRFKTRGSVAGGIGDEMEDKHTEYRQMVKRYGNLARVMGKGDSFGDQAITKPGTNRTASIICKTNCHFLIIDEQTYKEHLKRIADRKTETLMKTFSFLTQISSTQIRNLLVNNFQSEAFGKGDVITMEGPIKEKPYFYVLDDGLCKVEKQLLVETKNPYSKDEVFHKRSKWITICTIGHGTLIGEEILLQPNREEFYEFKVTVISKSATLLKTDKSFLGIHPDLETPIQQFYQAKVEQREEIYKSHIEEFYQKEKASLKNPETFLKEHALLARTLRKTSLDYFTLRTKRDEKNQSPKREASPTIERHQRQQTVVLKPETKPVPIQSPIVLQKTEISLSDANHSSNQLSIPARSSYQKSNQGANVQAGSLSTLRPSITPETNNNPIQVLPEPESKPSKTHSNARIETEQSETTKTVKKVTQVGNGKVKNPESKTVPDSTQQSVKSQTSLDKNKPKPQGKPKKIEIIVPKKTGGPRTIRLIEKHADLYERENVRESAQFMAQMIFLNSKEQPKAADVNKVDNFKFVFEDTKDNRMLEILRQKHLRLGVFSSRQSINYLQHGERPGSAFLKQVQHDQRKDSISKMRIITDNSIFVTNTLGSPRDRDSISSPGTAKTLPVSKQRPFTARISHMKESSISSAPINQYGLASPTLCSEDLLSQRQFTTSSYKEDQKSPNYLTTQSQDSEYSIKSEPLNLSSSPTHRKRVPPIHCNSDLPDVSDICKNPMYTNLMQKSINKKRLFQKRSLSGQISRPTSARSNSGVFDTRIRLQMQPYLMNPTSPR